MDKQHLPPAQYHHLAAAMPYQNALAQHSSAVGILQQNLSGHHPYHHHHHHHHPLAYQQFHQHQHQAAPAAQQPSHQHQQQIIQMFWANQMQEIENTVEFRNHSLPLARIKKIMKADEDVRMISAEAPVVFAKACEMFIHELTLRSWIHTEESKRRTLQKNDIAAAITRTDIFDFLVDIVPRDELKEVELLGNPRAALPVGAIGSSHSVPFYFLPQQHSTPRGIVVGKSVDSALFSPRPGSDPMAYAHQQM